MPPRVDFWVDAACYRLHGIAGYGIVMQHAGRKFETSGIQRRSYDSSRAELNAAVQALSLIERWAARPVYVYTDCLYVTLGAECAKGDKDLWGLIARLSRRHSVTFIKVEGHKGVIHNERAHILARAAAQQYIDSFLHPSEGEAS